MSRTLRPELVQPLLRGEFGNPYAYADTCPSTQELARGLPHGGVAACELQTAGRGRLGRGWESPRAKGVLFSLALEPRTAAAQLAPFSLVVAEAIASVLDDAARVRWPNDVVVDDRKLAGTLLELRAGRLIVGVGVNANLTSAELPDTARVSPTSLLLLRGSPVDRPQLLADLLAAIEQRYALFEHEGFTGLDRDDLRGRRVTLAGGRAGLCSGVDARGRLVVDGTAHTSDEVTAVSVDPPG